MSGSYVAIYVALCALASAHALRCNEGINMKVNGLPLYYWNQRQCTDNSKCIRQAITFSINVTGIEMDTSMQYGACMNAAYSDFLDCNNLFGKDSTFDPADFLDMIPDVERTVSNALEVAYKNASSSLKELLSDGTGVTSFVEGAFIFYEDLGFNLNKAVPLKPSLVKLLTSAIEGSDSGLNGAFREFVTAFSSLDTENTEFANTIRSLLTNLGVNVYSPQNQLIAIFIDRAPGLIRSILPPNWQMELWYDVAFKLAGNVNPANWTKSTEDMVATIKSSYLMPPDVAQYINPILDALPDLAQGSKTNPIYVGRWSLELLKQFSETDETTDAFFNALINVVQKITGGSLQGEYTTMIRWLPGLFYRFFPEDKTIIQEVYTKMAAGLKTFNPWSSSLPSAPDTKLSKLIVTLVPRLLPTGMNLPPIFNLAVTSISHMFYELMTVNSVDYTKYIDDFSTVIEDGFKDMANVNAGNIIQNLIIKMGGEVPPELKPMLSSIQPLITIVTAQPVNIFQAFNAIKDIVASYKSSYPNSPFPTLAERFMDLILRLLTVVPGTPISEINKINLDFQYWNIDLQFAIVKASNLESDEIYQMMAKAWPEYHLFIRIIKAMNPEDVKQMIKDVIAYISTANPPTIDGFTKAMKPSFAKITASINSLMREMRQWFAPDICQFTSCDDQDFCNSRELVLSQQAFKRDPLATLAPPSKSAGERLISTNVWLNIATLWMASKLFR